MDRVGLKALIPPQRAWCVLLLLALLCLPQGRLFRVTVQGQDDITSDVTGTQDAAAALEDAMLSSIADTGTMSRRALLRSQAASEFLSSSDSNDSSASRAGRAIRAGRRRGLQSHRPYVVAHRGASGTLPEHTAAAYHRAINEGADFIECDIVVTRDLQLICRHEPNLNDTTDAFAKFPERATSYVIDGKNVSGIFACDLTLQEVTSLRARQPWPFRDQSHNGRYAIATFSEYLDIALSAPRVVGIYPELKHPGWHNSLPLTKAGNTSIEDLTINVLHARGFKGRLDSRAWRAQPAVLQSFEVGALQYLASRTSLPLMLLLGGWPGYVTPDTGKSHEEMTTDASLAEIALYASAIGPWKASLYSIGADNRTIQSTGLVVRAQKQGLQVHPYTLRDEARFVPAPFNSDIHQEMQHLFEQEQVDGAFSDFPGTLHQYLEAAFPPEADWRQ